MPEWKVNSMPRYDEIFWSDSIDKNDMGHSRHNGVFETMHNDLHMYDILDSSVDFNKVFASQKKILRIIFISHTRKL